VCGFHVPFLKKNSLAKIAKIAKPESINSPALDLDAVSTDHRREMQTSASTDSPSRSLRLCERH
jgi:hypothetical protein